ncbi:MAG: glycosyltransferase, partial [Bryobacteraceae bacterium]
MCPEPRFHPPPMQSNEKAPVRLILDITNSTIDLANPGVIRVARRFSRELQNTGSPLFVVWDAAGNRYVLPTREEYERLSRFNGPVLERLDALSPGFWERVSLDEALERYGTGRPCLIFPETLGALRCRLMRPYARRLGLALAAIFHDAIPVMRPELVNPAIRLNHRDYMIGLGACDFVMPVSQFSADRLRTFWREHAVDVPVYVNWLPGEFAGGGRPAAGPGPDAPVAILCVSTLEPRKNHLRLIDACLRLSDTRPGLNWSLTLVGDRYSGAPLLVEYVERAAELNPRIRWLGVVDDETLGRLYSQSSFTVYPSTLEGFGMPVLESLWHARPCLCSNRGVTAELAAEGGCLTINVEESSELAAGIVRLIEDCD